MARRLLLTALVLAVGGCVEITTPPERATDYLGDWSGPNVTLSIRGSRITYSKRGGGLGSAYVESDFRGLSGNDIIYSKKKSRIRVSVPPRRDGAVWKMTVEDVELQRPALDGPPGGHAR